MHRLIAGAVLRPVTTSMVTVALLLFGWVALTRLPIELLPDLSYPTITVQTESVSYTHLTLPTIYSV